MKKSLLLFLLCISFLCQGQSILKGRVINEKTREPLAFVNIIIKNTFRGTTTDIDGRFELKISEKDVTLIFSYVGFETRSVLAHVSEKNISIRLREVSTELQEVVVRPGDNPAFRIIRQAIKNKPINDPENLNSFSYNSYNKLYSTLLNADSVMQKQDADTVKLKQYLHDNHLFVHESYTERKYLKPNYSKEVVLGNHLSGIKDPFFAFVATDLQPFTFYHDFISLFGKDYISPISKGNIERYDYTLSDTIIHETDSIYVIAFEPLSGKIFNALKGQVYISTDGFAIEHVIAEPAADKSLIETLIQQKYEKINDHWFPTQLNSEFRFTQFEIQGFKLKYVSHSYLTNIKINEDSIRSDDFGLVNIEFAPQANHRDSSFWKENRTGEFDKKDENTFHALDSLGEKIKAVQTAFKIFEGLFIGRFKAGAFYIPIEHIVQFNQYEGARLGFGFQTGEQISKRFVLEGYTGYGFNDKALKYGGSFQINVYAKKEMYLKVSYKQDLSEPGRWNFIKGAIAARTQESIRNLMSSRMDSVEQYKGEFNVRPFRFTELSVYLQQQKRNPAYGYQYIPDGEQSGVKKFIVTEAGMQWRFAFNEKFMKVGETKIITGTSYPQLNISISKSFTGLANGQFDFIKLETRLDHQFLTKAFGKTTLHLTTGILSGNAPYPYLFNARGSKYNNSVLNSVIAQNTFQTMGLYEFLADQYACLFLNQNFGRITGNKSRYFRPELSIIHNMGIGKLSHQNRHQDIVFSSMEKGYFESGLILTNLIKINYMNLLYFGIGGGSFYRYGSYQLPAMKDNFATKFILTIGF
jgi:hypothetical protein